MAASVLETTEEAFNGAFPEATEENTFRFTPPPPSVNHGAADREADLVTAVGEIPGQGSTPLTGPHRSTDTSSDVLKWFSTPDRSILGTSRFVPSSFAQGATNPHSGIPSAPERTGVEGVLDSLSTNASSKSWDPIDWFRTAGASSFTDPSTLRSKRALEPPGVASASADTAHHREPRKRVQHILIDPPAAFVAPPSFPPPTPPRVGKQQLQAAAVNVLTTYDDTQSHDTVAAQDALYLYALGIVVDRMNSAQFKGSTIARGNKNQFITALQTLATNIDTTRQTAGPDARRAADYLMCTRMLNFMHYRYFNGQVAGSRP